MPWPYFERWFPPGDVGDVATELAEKLAGAVFWLEQDIRPRGYTVDTLACALWRVANSQSLEETVVKVVNLGGTPKLWERSPHGLAGVMYGYNAIPAKWAAKFSDAQKKRLETATAGLVQLALESAERRNCPGS